MDNPDDKSQEAIQSELIEARKNGEKIASLGREITEVGQFLVDLADANYQVLRYFPAPDPNATLTLWRDFNLNACNAIGSFQNSMPYISAASSTAGTATTSFFVYRPLSDDHIGYLPFEDREPAREAIDNLYRVASRPQIKSKAIDILKEWGLNHRSLNKLSPLELFEIAYLAYEGPVTEEDPTVTSLIPMRSCINGVIAELLRLRPSQVATKKSEKIQSIGRQLIKDQLGEDSINAWAYQWTMLNDQLSASKDCIISRDDWGLRLHSATMFLVSFLEGLDQSKCRRKS